ncbi:MAG: MmcQ/YjbR family DNA-binding protein [Mucilaginibacter sp.]
MNIEVIRDICMQLPNVTEDIKWGDDLCFCIADKMFCVAVLSPPLKVSLKVADNEFEELSSTPGIIPAPYVARYKWILVEDVNRFTANEWEYYICQSYALVKARLPKRKQESLK